MKKTVLIIASILCGMVLISSGCASKDTRPVSVSVILNQKLMNIGGRSADDLAEELREIDECKTEGIEIEENEVHVILTEKQQREWIEYLKNKLQEHKEYFSSLSDKYKIDVNDDFTEASLYYNLNLDGELANTAVMETEFYCAMIQSFKLINDWYVALNIYNCDTGKLVKHGDSENAFSYNTKDWAQSK